MSKKELSKKYEFYDTFIKSCEYVDGKGKCKSSRKTKKCVDDKCENVVMPKDKREVLEDFYKQYNYSKKSKMIKDSDKSSDEFDEQWFDKKYGGQGCQIEAEQLGGAMDPELKKKLIGNISKKYKCPFCNSYKHKESFVEHTQSHLDRYGVKKIKKLFKKEKGVNIAKMSEKTKEILREYNKNEKVDKQHGKGELRRFSPDKLSYVESEEGNYLKYFGIQSGSGNKNKGNYIQNKIKIPQNVRKTAFYAFKLKQKGFKEGHTVDINIAKQLITKNYISIEDLRYIRNWFSRHLRISYPIYKNWADLGRPKNCMWHNKHSITLWLLWGGNSSFKWVNSDKNIKIINDHFKTNYKKLQL